MAWHLFVHDEGEIHGSIRLNYHRPSATWHSLGLKGLIERMHERDKANHAIAITESIAWAKQCETTPAEIGGWAISEEARRTMAGILLAVATTLVGERFPFVALAAATVRHQSNEMLIRLGGTPLRGPGGVALPPVYDAVYGCEMQILRFHWQCAAKYHRMRAAIREVLGEKLNVFGQ
jgi:hypothetical protein